LSGNRFPRFRIQRYGVETAYRIET
jgi:hypothetical protein